jgi:TonB family protein
MTLPLHLLAVLLISSLMLDPIVQSRAKQSDAEREELLGGVRTVVQERADLVGDLKKPIEVSRYRDQSETYDRQGNIVEAIDYGAHSGDIIERTLTPYYVVPAGMIKAVPYEVVAELSNPSAAPPPGVVEKKGILIRGQILTRVQPAYPPAAKLARISGEVKVEAVIDEEGKVIYARATSGHPLLRDSAEVAARQWRFSPTTIDGKAVKVLSAIVLRFNL